MTVRSQQGDLDSKLVVVEGDILKSNDLGIDEVIKRRLLDDVSVVFHLAATVSFNEPLRYLRLISLITCSAVAPSCCISHSDKYRKMTDFDPSGSQNP